MVDLQKAVVRYGADAKAKLANPAATGGPEDQLRAPLEALFADLAELCGFPRGLLAAVGESWKAQEMWSPSYVHEAGWGGKKIDHAGIRCPPRACRQRRKMTDGSM